MNSCDFLICCSPCHSLFKKSKLSSNGQVLAENELSKSEFLETSKKKKFGSREVPKFRSFEVGKSGSLEVWKSGSRIVTLALVKSNQFFFTLGSL